MAFFTTYQDNPLVNSKIIADFVPKICNLKISLKDFFFLQQLNKKIDVVSVIILFFFDVA